MHTVQTFILRLLVDPARPEVLQGALQAVPDGKPQPFDNEVALLAPFRRHIAAAEAKAAKPIEPKDEAV
jgi:hypothetical protein